MKITVTQADIDGASAGASKCPIARAVKRITGHPYTATASQAYIGLHSEDSMSTLKTFKPSRNAVAFMGRFDDDQVVKPAVFICPENKKPNVPAS